MDETTGQHAHETDDAGTTTRPEPAARRSWRDRASALRQRAYGLRGLVAVALAAVVLGGLGGFVAGAATGAGDDGGDRRPARVGGPGGLPARDDDGRHGRLGGVPGQLPPTTPPTTPPEDEAGSSST